MKAQVKNAAIKVISVTGAVLHTTVTASSLIMHEVGDVLAAGSGYIAKGEGYLTNQVDPSQSAAQVADNRAMATGQLFITANQRVNNIRQQAKAQLLKAKSKVNEFKDSMLKKDAISIEIKQKSTNVWHIIVDKVIVKKSKDSISPMIFKSEDEAMQFVQDNYINEPLIATV